MLASSPASILNQNLTDLGIPNRFTLNSSRFSGAAWPLASRAQQPTMPVVGYLSVGSPEADADRTAAIRLGLKEAGYIAGDNLITENRWAHGEYDRLSALAAELVRRQVAAIVTVGTPPAIAAKAA